MEADHHILQKNWESLEIPEVVEVEHQENPEEYAEFIFDPLQKGFGYTIGQTLKRVLFMSLQGSALFGVSIAAKIDDSGHIRGVREDIANLILNLKDLKLRQKSEKDVTLQLSASGPKTVTGADISTSGKAEIFNPDQVICHIEKKTSLKINLYIRLNHGFVEAKENKSDQFPEGTIFLDSNHSPIRRIVFEVINTRVGQKMDYDKLIFRVWTNGLVRPESAVSYASNLLRNHFNFFINFDEDLIRPAEENQAEEYQYINPNLYKNINELELSVRSLNCLKNADIGTIGDLVQKTSAELLKTKNFGRKSLHEINRVLASMGLVLGMKLDDFDKVDMENSAVNQINDQDPA